jgi:hypothetical protein
MARISQSSVPLLSVEALRSQPGWYRRHSLGNHDPADSVQLAFKRKRPVAPAGATDHAARRLADRRNFDDDRGLAFVALEDLVYLLHGFDLGPRVGAATEPNHDRFPLAGILLSSGKFGGDRFAHNLERFAPPLQSASNVEDGTFMD